VFHTKGGREVRDGGGIKPDIEVKPDSLPNIAYYLATSGMDSTEVMLKYEIDYIKRHPTIAPPSQFQLSDADYAEFKQRVLKSGFKYDPETERYMDNLIKLAKFEGYYDEAKDDFDRLQQKLTHNLDHDLDYHKDTIKKLLETDIVAAYYYQRGAAENGLRTDKVMKEALQLIQDTERYRGILSGVKE
jgi:carboxyl-terminal processing protease